MSFPLLDSFLTIQRITEIHPEYLLLLRLNPQFRSNIISQLFSEIFLFLIKFAPNPYIIICNIQKKYSMIVATRPEPTILPPSRHLHSVFCGIFYAFYCRKQRKIVVFGWCIFICMISWHCFGAKTSLLLNCSIYMVLEPCIKNINKENINSLFSTTLINKLEFDSLTN